MTLFPVGGLHKDEVRALARDAGLPVSEKPESQEICFVPEGDYRDVVRARTPGAMRPGAFVDLTGRVLGAHAGHQGFTVGQRRGIGVALGQPAYVLDIDASTGTVTLGGRKDLERSAAELSEVQWMSIDPPTVGAELRIEAQIRHRRRTVSGTVIRTGASTASLRFDEPEEAVTPGQAAVLYSGDVLLGGGWIDSAR